MVSAARARINQPTVDVSITTNCHICKTHSEPLSFIFIPNVSSIKFARCYWFCWLLLRHHYWNLVRDRLDRYSWFNLWKRSNSAVPAFDVFNQVGPKIFPRPYSVQTESLRFLPWRLPWKRNRRSRHKVHLRGILMRASRSKNNSPPRRRPRI